MLLADPARVRTVVDDRPCVAGELDGDLSHLATQRARIGRRSVTQPSPGPPTLEPYGPVARPLSKRYAGPAPAHRRDGKPDAQPDRARDGRMGELRHGGGRAD